MGSYISRRQMPLICRVWKNNSHYLLCCIYRANLITIFVLSIEISLILVPLIHFLDIFHTPSTYFRWKWSIAEHPFFHLIVTEKADLSTPIPFDTTLLSESSLQNLSHCHLYRNWTSSPIYTSPTFLDTQSHPHSFRFFVSALPAHNPLLVLPLSLQCLYFILWIYYPFYPLPGQLYKLYLLLHVFLIIIYQILKFARPLFFTALNIFGEVWDFLTVFKVYDPFLIHSIVRTLK